MVLLTLLAFTKNTLTLKWSEVASLVQMFTVGYCFKWSEVASLVQMFTVGYCFMVNTFAGIITCS